MKTGLGLTPDLMRVKTAKNVTFHWVVLGLWLCCSAQAQIALQDGSTNLVADSGSATISTNFTVTWGASVLVVSLFDRDAQSTNNSPASLSWAPPGYGAQTLTRAVSENNAGSTYADSDIYYLFNPNPGTAAITATDTSGNTPSAMTMQAYTLRGVATTVPPVTYAANNPNALSVSVALSASTPAYAWAVVNSSYGTGPSTMYVASSSGAPSCPEINNVTSQCMGYVANLNAGAGTITAGNGAGLQKMALAVTVFNELVTGPPAPTNLVATPQASQVALSWDDASGGAATNYIVFRSTTSDIGYTAIATNTSNTATNYTDTGLTPWTTYYYVVRAVAVSGTSVYSAQASAAPLGLPTAPTGLWAIPGNAVVVLNWDNQPSATVFNVLRSTTSGSGFTTIATVTTNTYTDTAVVNGTTYYYELNATNSFGTSGNSAQISAIPTAVPNVHLLLNASNAVRTADRRWFGMNTGVFDDDFNLQLTVPEAQAAGWTTFRYPGGSLSDTYHWAIPNSVYGTNNFQNFATVATNLGATVFITANYGTGTPAEAAGWVADANVTNHYGFKYWEIGNEEYGTWETDSNAYPHDPHCYATNFVVFIQQMKAVDPTIKVGAVVVPGETTYSNGYTNHPATNLITGQVVYGWTPVLLSTLQQAGVTPDFLIHHWYPENGQDSDQMLLGVTTNFSGAATDLRDQITDYFGPGGTNIELDITENNSDSATPGKQSVSLVNALYYADSLGQIMQTEFNARLWWLLNNGGPPSTDGDMSTNLYGWRMYGTFGVVDGEQGLIMTNRYPPYFGAELISHFVGAGDTVVTATSDNALVSAYAALRTNGTLTLLAINKQPYTNYWVNIALTNCNPSAAATVYFYGMPQDNAASAANNNCDIATNSASVGANFNYTLPPYSANVFVFTLQPAAPSLSAVPFAGAGQFVLQLAGQTNVPYVLETSSNLYNWTPVATDTLTSGVLDVTNAVAPGTGQQFWRAVWSP
ncbi:MAG: fibronectin type III domain-containing protein [Verrucomicrobiota bacterium]